MKIEVNGNCGLVLKEVFSGVQLETEEGNRLGVCMRDNSFDICVMPRGKFPKIWFRVDMEKCSIERV